MHREERGLAIASTGTFRSAALLVTPLAAAGIVAFAPVSVALAAGGAIIAAPIPMALRLLRQTREQRAESPA